MAAQTFKLQGGSLGADDISELYVIGFPGSTESSGVITIDPTDLAGNDALDKFSRLIRYCEAAGGRLQFVEST